MKGRSVPSSTVENYVKQLYLEQAAGTGQMIPMGRLATLMRVVPGTATSMVKALADSGLVEYEPRTGVRLSAHGERLALHVLRRHRLLELFLVKVLGLDWSEVHDEAEELEHVISDKVLQRIDEVLGHPDADPHGDPIPSAQGQVAEAPLLSLATCPLRQGVRIARVLDQEPHFLQFVRQCGLVPGATLVVRERNTQADAVTVHPEAMGHVTLSTAAAGKFLVKPL